MTTPYDPMLKPLANSLQLIASAQEILANNDVYSYFTSPSLGQYGLVRVTRETGAVEYLAKRVVEIGGVDSTVYFWHALPMES